MSLWAAFESWKALPCQGSGGHRFCELNCVCSAQSTRPWSCRALPCPGYVPRAPVSGLRLSKFECAGVLSLWAETESVHVENGEAEGRSGRASAEVDSSRRPWSVRTRRERRRGAVRSRAVPPSGDAPAFCDGVGLFARERRHRVEERGPNRRPWSGRTRLRDGPSRWRGCAGAGLAARERSHRPLCPSGAEGGSGRKLRRRPRSEGTGVRGRLLRRAGGRTTRGWPL